MTSYPYHIPPPPPPPVGPIPNMGDFVYEIAVPPSPHGSPPRRDPYVVYGGDDRRKDYFDDRSRLAVGRSQSTKERRAASVHVGDSKSRDRSRPRSYYKDGRYDDEYNREKRYYGGGTYYPDSDYSGSSRDSRENSRHRSHYRTPSAHSEYDYPPYPTAQVGWPGVPPPPPPPPGPHHHMQVALAPAPGQIPPHPANQPLIHAGSMVPWQGPPNPVEDQLTQKIKELTQELNDSKKESEKIKQAKEQEEERKKKENEIKAEVARIIQQQEAERAKVAAERARIEKEEKDRAEALAKAMIQAEKDAAEKKKKDDEEFQKKVQEEFQKKMAEMKLDVRKPTHTKFSKTHLCKEALDEKGIKYTEHEDSFLVHRWVDRDEQNALWARTKQIRAYQLEYQKRFKEEADKAPVIDTPNGPVKIVRVGQNPPVTVPVVLVTKKVPVEPDAKLRNLLGLR